MEQRAAAGIDRPDLVVVERPRLAVAFGRAIRPRQWVKNLVKNLLVFAAPGAAGVLGSPGVLGRACLALLAFLPTRLAPGSTGEM